MDKQLFMRLEDVIPTSISHLNPNNFIKTEDNAPLFEANFDCVKAYAESIRTEGMKTAIEVDENGAVRDGECRRRCAVFLKWRFVPVVVVPGNIPVDPLISPLVLGGPYKE